MALQRGTLHDILPAYPVVVGLLVALAVTFLLAFPWAKETSRSLDIAIGKAIGTSVLICGGWVLLGYAILYAACGR